MKSPTDWDVLFGGQNYSNISQTRMCIKHYHHIYLISSISLIYLQISNRIVPNILLMFKKFCSVTADGYPFQSIFK